ncbi:MAG TPA: hypothetical protein VIJ20_09515 [Solirubrobacteraceae bacterium]
MSSWWLGLPPAQTTITCGGHAHRLRWEAGALRAIDHEDPEAERALAALGGERCPCMEVLEAWGRHAGDPRVLVLASRGPADPITAQADWTAQLGARAGAVTPPRAIASPAPSRGFFRRPGRRHARAVPAGSTAHPSPLAPPQAGPTALGTQSESELVALLGLGGGLQDRLVASVAAAWTARFEQPDAELGDALPALHASMQGRLTAAVRSWLGRADVELVLDLIEARGTPSLAESSGIVRAELPFAWLGEVWSRGLVIVLGRFCLAARTDDGQAWTLTTIGPDLGPIGPVRIELPTEQDNPPLSNDHRRRT